MNYFKYNPIYSFFRYLNYRLHRRIVYPDQNLEQNEILSDSKQYKIFLEIDILDRKKVAKRGSAVFRIIFHTPYIPAEKIISRTRYTIPFFSGLPGFCTKKFMVNKEERKFSGLYEWETIEMAQKYARSFALNFMKHRSRPFPVFYEIIDKKTNEIIETMII